MLPLLHDECWGDVDHCAPNSAGRFNGQVQVLDLVIDVAAFQVDSRWRNRRHLAKNCRIDELAA